VKSQSARVPVASIAWPQLWFCLELAIHGIKEFVQQAAAQFGGGAYRHQVASPKFSGQTTTQTGSTISKLRGWRNARIHILSNSRKWSKNECHFGTT